MPERRDQPGGAVVRDGSPDGPATAEERPGAPAAAHPAATAGTDEVDRIVDAWQRERPDLDVTPLAVLSRVTRLSRHLDLARRSSFAAHGLEAWEFDVLAALRRAGRPYELPPRELLRLTMVSSGTTTNRIDRLEQRGQVRRQPDPGDRRGVLVRLTPAGRRAVDGAFETLLASERELLSGLSNRRRGELAGLLRMLTRTFDEPRP